MRERVLAALLVLVGLTALGGAYFGLRRVRAPRPESTGAIGEVTAYGQTVEGPRPLTAGRTALLPRPQSFAFQLDAPGTGPRLVRIAVDAGEGPTPLHEVRLAAPARQRSLDYVARFGEEAPDDLTLIVTVEAPHAAPRTRRFPVRLATESHRYWDPSAP